MVISCESDPAATVRLDRQRRLRKRKQGEGQGALPLWEKGVALDLRKSILYGSQALPSTQEPRRSLR
jgi:hypothetical protein